MRKSIAEIVLEACVNMLIVAVIGSFLTIWATWWIVPTFSPHPELSVTCIPATQGPSFQIKNEGKQAAKDIYLDIQTNNGECGYWSDVLSSWLLSNVVENKTIGWYPNIKGSTYHWRMLLRQEFLPPEMSMPQSIGFICSTKVSMQVWAENAVPVSATC